MFVEQPAKWEVSRKNFHSEIINKFISDSDFFVFDFGIARNFRKVLRISRRN